MRNFSYLLLDIGALGSALAIGWRREHDWLRRWRISVKVVGLVGGLFVLWDVTATARGHWYFNSDFTLGPRLLGLPLEEWLFFIAIPLVSLATWRLTTAERRHHTHRGLVWAVAASGFIMAAANVQHEYSLMVGLATIATAALWLRVGVPRGWLTFQLAMLVLFILANTFLTALPIVQYNSPFISGLRLGPIPLEDFFYNFVLSNVTVIAWRLFARNEQSKSDSMHRHR